MRKRFGLDSPHPGGDGTWAAWLESNTLLWGIREDKNIEVRHHSETDRFYLIVRGDYILPHLTGLEADNIIRGLIYQGPIDEEDQTR